MARCALSASVVASLALVVLTAAAPSTFVPPSKEAFPLWMAGPLLGVASIVPGLDAALSFVFAVLVAAMLAAYLVALTCASRVSGRWAWGSLVAAHVVFTLGPPLTLTDVFNYIGYARLDVVYGVNPYVTAPVEVPVDAAYPYATWHNLTSPYGPLFTLGTYPLALLGLPAAFWLLKLATAAASLVSLVLVGRIAQRLGRPAIPAVLLVGLNPLVLVYGLGGVHNDFFVTLAMLAGIGLLASGRPARAGAALVAAAAIKLSAGLVLAFALLGSRRRVELAGGMAAAGAGLAALSIAAFGAHLPGLDTQSSLVTPFSVPNLVGLALGQGGATALVRMAFLVALMVVVARLALRTAQGDDWLTMAGWAMLALVLSLAWMMPWYVLWPLVLAAVSPAPALRRAVLWLTVFATITFSPLTGYLLTEACGCSPSDTEVGKRNAAEIRRYLR